MNKDLLIISSYFPPERGAASNRIQALARSLNSKGYSVRVVCPMPNYPTGKVFEAFKGKIMARDHSNGFVVDRLWIWPSNSTNKIVRLLSMLSFAISLKLYLIFSRSPKVALIQYSPILIGFTGAFWSWALRKKIVLNISDLWPLAGVEMGLLKEGFYTQILEQMECFCIKKSDLVIGQSDEILKHVKAIRPRTNVFRYRNYPDFTPPALVQNHKEDEKHLFYAGLLGVAQSLYHICLSLRLPENVFLHIYGTGPEATKIKELRNTQIRYHGEFERTALHRELMKHDIAFVPLTRRIYGSVPSKIFEFSRLGFPLLYYAGGEGADIVKEHQLGWVVEAGNIDALQQTIDYISVNNSEQFSKEIIRKKAMTAFDFSSQIIELEKYFKGL